MVIGYYVHHVGAGHRTRARALTAALRARGHEVVLIGSDLGGAAGLHLPRDDDDADRPWRDPEAGGALHWAPLGHSGFGGRMALIAEWVTRARPDVVVVDVSVEVTVALRLLGVPTVVMAQPGDRSDPAHTLGYRCASAIVAPWPHVAGLCPALGAFGAKVHHVGGISSIAGERRSADVGVVLSGRDGWGCPVDLTELRRHTPGMRWAEVGGDQWVDDVGALLLTARVVVTHAGQNAVADVARCTVPTVVIPQERPHGEQHHMAQELERLGLAVALDDAGPRTPWSQVVDEAASRASRWWVWRTERSAERAAAVIEAAA